MCMYIHFFCLSFPFVFYPSDMFFCSSVDLVVFAVELIIGKRKQRARAKRKNNFKKINVLNTILGILTMSTNANNFNVVK